MPSRSPSKRPSRSPSRTPSKTPSRSPSKRPSRAPSRTPSKVPSRSPSKRPSKSPSRTPSRAPSRTPSKRPSRSPSRVPSMMPSGPPSQKPSKSPSKSPSSTPSSSPFIKPFAMPSLSPSTQAPTITVSPTTGTPSTSDCRPEFGASINQCSSLVKVCRAQQILMKWSGKGCRGKKGVVLGDGGCQCVGYCGYRCKSACNRDKTCHWKQDRCLVKATNQAGGPIPACPALTAPPG